MRQISPVCLLNKSLFPLLNISIIHVVIVLVVLIFDSRLEQILYRGDTSLKHASLRSLIFLIYLANIILPIEQIAVRLVVL